MNRPADCAEPFSSVNAMSMAGSEVLGKAVRLAHTELDVPDEQAG